MFITEHYYFNHESYTQSGNVCGMSTSTFPNKSVVCCFIIWFCNFWNVSV